MAKHEISSALIKSNTVSRSSLQANRSISRSSLQANRNISGTQSSLSHAPHVVGTRPFSAPLDLNSARASDTLARSSGPSTSFRSFAVETPGRSAVRDDWSNRSDSNSAQSLELRSGICTFA